jgi:hypothetical protein
LDSKEALVMPQFLITAPDGTKYQVSGPEGSTEQDALAQVQAQHQSTPADPLAAYRAEHGPADAPGLHFQSTIPADAYDKFSGSKLGRFGIGAESLLSGPLQLGANIGGAITGDSSVADALNARIQAEQLSKRRGMDANGTKGFDWMGLAGGVLPAVAGGATGKIAESLLGRMGQGAATGGFFGATSPVVNGGGEFWKDKAIQTGTGAALGAAVPVAASLVKSGGKAVRDAFDVLTGTEGGIDRLKRAYYQRLVGPDNVTSVVNSLQTVDSLIAGGKPTAAEAVSGNPYGSPIQAQQQVTASTYGGPSGQFGQRAANQEIARGSAEIERNAVTGPLRDAALARATNINGRVLNNDMMEILASPETQAVKPAREFLEKIADDAITAGQSGDPKALYSVRKYIDDLINKRIDSPENVAGYASTQLIAMKKVIDDAIKNGGAGSSWSDYLAEYAKRSQAIDSSTERAATMYQPAQRTSVPGASDIASSTSTHLPNLLSRSAMIANYFARMARSNVEPKIDESMAKDFLNPQLMADVLNKSTPAARKLLADAVSKYGNTAITVSAIKAPQGN